MSLEVLVALVLVVGVVGFVLFQRNKSKDSSEPPVAGGGKPQDHNHTQEK